MTEFQIPDNLNVAAHKTPYFTPIQEPPAGTGLGLVRGSVDDAEEPELPKLFQPIQIRGVLFPNRIWLSPLCQYSAQNGHLTPWHMAHLGGILTRGPGHTMIEATAVTANGRITPEDSGIWSDEHIAQLASIVTFAHSQNQKIGIQLAHAGRKASTIAPWISGNPLASEAVGGWPEDVWGPSDVPYNDQYPKVKALSKEGIQSVVQAFGDAAGRALKAGFDVMEIHGAHGYLLSSFLSPVANKRTDGYGGSFENRTRLILEVVDKVRSVIPEQMPLFFRISGTDWLEESSEPSWHASDTALLAPLLYAHGVDLIDISSGGNSPNQKIGTAPIVPAGMHAYQAPLAKTVMDAIGAKNAYRPPSPPPPHHGAHKLAEESSAEASNKDNMLAEISNRPDRLIVSTVGSISSGVVAENLLQEGYADVVMVGRHFQKNPGAVWQFAEELGVNIQLASQIRWAFKGRGKKATKK